MISAMILFASMQAAAVPAKAESDGNKMICRSELELGSRIPKRICRTKQEREQMARDSAEEMRKMGRNHSVQN